MYTKKYLNDLDKRLKMVPLISDYMFKAIMLRNVDIFKNFLIETMNIDIKPEENYILFLDKELIKENFKEKGKIVDINVKLGNNLIIDVEVNREKFEIVKERNDLYLSKLDITQLEVGEEYRDLKNKYIYQLNLNAYPSSKENFKKRYIVEYDLENKEVFDLRKRKFVKNLVYYRNLYYNGGELLTNDEIFMAGLMSKSFSELYSIMSNILSGNDLNKFIESVINMSNDEFILHAWQKEKFDKMIEERKKELALEEGLEEGRKIGIEEGKLEGKEEGLKEGKKEGLKEGLKEGKEQSTIEVIRAMIKNNASYEFISNVTGKSIEEIKKIENE